MNRVIEEGQLYHLAKQRLDKEHSPACVIAAKNVFDPLCRLRHNRAGALDEYVAREILATHDDPRSIKRTLHLCEAPGGFVHGCIAALGDKLDWHAISLTGDQKACPKFHPGLKAQTRPNGRFRVHRGDDGTGDVTVAANRKRLFYDIGVESIDFVTADAECDRDKSPPRLLAAEMVIAAMLMVKGGTLAARLPARYIVADVEEYRWIYSLFDAWFDRVEVVSPDITAVDDPLRVYAVGLGFRGVAVEDLEPLVAYAYEDAPAHSVDRAQPDPAWLTAVGEAVGAGVEMTQKLSSLAFYLGQIGVTTHEKAGEMYSDNVVHNPGRARTIKEYTARFANIS